MKSLTSLNTQTCGHHVSSVALYLGSPGAQQDISYYPAEGC